MEGVLITSTVGKVTTVILWHPPAGPILCLNTMGYTLVMIRSSPRVRLRWVSDTYIWVIIVALSQARLRGFVKVVVL